jgi:uncharacterized OsmC-like protein
LKERRHCHASDNQEVTGLEDHSTAMLLDQVGANMNLESLCRNADRLFFRQHINIQCQKEGDPHMSQTTINDIINGVDVGQLGTTVDAVRRTPSLATFRFRAANQWIDGSHNRSTIKGFYGAGQEDTFRSTPFVLDSDKPLVLLGKNHGPTPVEFVLHALAACLTTSLVYHAAARGIRIESVESKLEGDLDLHGFLGLSENIRKGYQQIRASFTVKSDASQEQLEDLTKFSPVYDIVSNPVPISIAITAQPTS